MIMKCRVTVNVSLLVNQSKRCETANVYSNATGTKMMLRGSAASLPSCQAATWSVPPGPSLYTLLE